MKRAVILHGTIGSPDGNWFHWLAAELKKRDFAVWLPTLPQPEQPSLRYWSDFIDANSPFPLDGDTMLIGHSSGAILSLILTQEANKSLGAVVGVSVFRDNSLGWEPNSRLFDVPFDFPAIKQHAQRLLFIHSDNDPYIPLAQAQYIADNCEAELVVITGQGHFNLEQSDDYVRFPKLLELLEVHKLV